MAYKPKKKKTESVQAPAPIQQTQEAQAQQLAPAQPIAQQAIQQETAQTVEEGSTWSVQEMITETAPIIVNNQTGEKLDMLAALTKILNTLEELEVE